MVNPLQRAGQLMEHNHLNYECRSNSTQSNDAVNCSKIPKTPKKIEWMIEKYHKNGGGMLLEKMGNT